MTDRETRTCSYCGYTYTPTEQHRRDRLTKHCSPTCRLAEEQPLSNAGQTFVSLDSGASDLVESQMDCGDDGATHYGGDIHCITHDCTAEEKRDIREIAIEVCLRLLALDETTRNIVCRKVTERRRGLNYTWDRLARVEGCSSAADAESRFRKALRRHRWMCAMFPERANPVERMKGAMT